MQAAAATHSGLARDERFGVFFGIFLVII